MARPKKIIEEVTMARPKKIIEEVIMEQTPAKKRYKLTIHSGESDSDKGDVVLIHNYRQILIQRDKEVEVDAEFVEGCLANSKIETTVKDLDTGKERTVQIARFAYSASPV